MKFSTLRFAVLSALCAVGYLACSNDKPEPSTEVDAGSHKDCTQDCGWERDPARAELLTEFNEDGSCMVNDTRIPAEGTCSSDGKAIVTCGPFENDGGHYTCASEAPGLWCYVIDGKPTCLERKECREYGTCRPQGTPCTLSSECETGSCVYYAASANKQEEGTLERVCANDCAADPNFCAEGYECTELVDKNGVAGSFCLRPGLVCEENEGFSPRCICRDPDDEICTSGFVCDEPWLVCSGSGDGTWCRDITLDNDYCGDCQTECTGSQERCIDGACVVPES